MRILTRRQFAATLAAFVSLMLSRRAWAKKVGLGLAKLPALQAVGGSTTLRIKELDIMLVRDSATSVRAINPNCTHKQCKVLFNAKTQKLNCKCHRSAFELDGKVLGGPAPRPLETYPTALKGEQLIITLPG